MIKPAMFFLAIALLVAGVLLLRKTGHWLDARDPNNQSEENEIADFVPEIKPADYELGEGEPWITDFQLVDQTGSGFESKALRDKVWVASFFFASCPSTCIQQNQEMLSLHKVWARKGVKFISISCDADNDTPAVLSSYAKKFTSDNENWKFLTGNSQYINRIGSDKFLLSVGPRTHAESFCAVDKWGNVRGTFNWHKVEAMEELNKLLVALSLEETEPADVAADRERLEKQIAEFVKQQITDTATEPSVDE
jgi:cytochrome oxidase Cu insertion factor (SCO1/SenC/PrrC family)